MAADSELVRGVLLVGPMMKHVAVVVAMMTGCVADESPEAGEDGELDSITGKADAWGIADDGYLADAVVRFASTASGPRLTALGIQRRTVTAVTSAARPFTSLAAVDAVPFTGPVFFGKLVAEVTDADLVGQCGDGIVQSLANETCDGGPSCRVDCTQAGTTPTNIDAEWSAWPVPAVDPPASAYQVGGGIVRDTVTGLEWQQAHFDLMTRSYAELYCNALDLNGTGWRLPTLVELSSIVNYGTYNAAITQSVFPGTPARAFWTATSAGATRLPSAMGVYFMWGDHGVYSATVADNRYSRCVRSPNHVVPGSFGAPAGRYVVTTDIVQDTVTGLRWQRRAPTTTSSWATAKTYCQNLPLGTGIWRVPTVKELQSLADSRGLNPAIDVSAFPDTVSDFYFTSTPYAYDTAKPWGISFSSGQTVILSAANVANIRCVQ